MPAARNLRGPLRARNGHLRVPESPAHPRAPPPEADGTPAPGNCARRAPPPDPAYGARSRIMFPAPEPEAPHACRPEPWRPASGTKRTPSRARISHPSPCSAPGSGRNARPRQLREKGSPVRSGLRSPIPDHVSCPGAGSPACLPPGTFAARFGHGRSTSAVRHRTEDCRPGTGKRSAAWPGRTKRPQVRSEPGQAAAGFTSGGETKPHNLEADGETTGSCPETGRIRRACAAGVHSMMPKGHIRTGITEGAQSPLATLQHPLEAPVRNTERRAERSGQREKHPVRDAEKGPPPPCFRDPAPRFSRRERKVPSPAVQTRYTAAKRRVPRFRCGHCGACR